MRGLKILKDYILFIIILLVIIFVIIYVNNNSFDVPYSTYNSNDDGTKALYLLCERMGYNAKRYKKPAMFLNDDILNVLIKPNKEFYSDREQKYLKSWVERGNVLLIVENNKIIFDSFLFKDAISKKRKEYFEFKLKEGKIIVMIEPKSLRNKGIFSNNRNGIAFIEILDNLEIKNIFLNEFYHGFGSEKIDVWDIMEEKQIYLILQILLIIILYLYTKSKRFGMATNLVDLDNREENENIYALSNIFTKAKAYIIVLNIYKELFYKDLNLYLGYNYEYILDNNLNINIANIDIKETLIRLFKLTENNKRDKRNNKNKKEIYNLIKDIELVRREIKNE